MGGHGELQIPPVRAVRGHRRARHGRRRQLGLPHARDRRHPLRARAVLDIALADTRGDAAHEDSGERDRLQAGRSGGPLGRLHHPPGHHHDPGAQDAVPRIQQLPRAQHDGAVAAPFTARGAHRVLLLLAPQGAPPSHAVQLVPLAPPRVLRHRAHHRLRASLHGAPDVHRQLCHSARRDVGVRRRIHRHVLRLPHRL